MRPPRRRDETGSATLELAVLTPAALAVLGVVVLAGHVESARAVVAQAAQDAARAATMARDQTTARSYADSAASSDLAGRNCRTWSLGLIGTLKPGATLTATVTCTTGLGILPGAFTTSHSSGAVVDPLRGVG